MYYYYESDMVSENPFKKPVFYFSLVCWWHRLQSKTDHSSVTAGHSILYA